MPYADFVVRYDPKTENSKDLGKKIIHSLIIKRLKRHKPVYLFIGGDSGEGKSFTAIELQMMLLEMQGISYKENMNNINVFTPLQYAEKFDKLLFNKDYKKLNVIVLHEAREVIRAKTWYSFLNQSVADINAMSRSVKKLCVIIISQFIRDISSDIRYTLTYYSTVKRNTREARLYINAMWKDDRDLEKPKLRKRKIFGYIIYPNGKWRKYVPKYIIVDRPPKEITDEFERLDFEAKSGIVRKKLDQLLKEMKKEVGDEGRKVDTMVEWYITHPDNLNLIGKRRGKKWNLKPEVKRMHDLTASEIKEFEIKLNDRINSIGLAEVTRPEDEVEE